MRESPSFLTILGIVLKAIIALVLIVVAIVVSLVTIDQFIYSLV